ncbi:MAG: hypothetical protein AB1473_20585 [Thermodesulfobacteriota bacterium]
MKTCRIAIFFAFIAICFVASPALPETGQPVAIHVIIVVPQSNGAPMALTRFADRRIAARQGLSAIDPSRVNSPAIGYLDSVNMLPGGNSTIETIDILADGPFPQVSRDSSGPRPRPPTLPRPVMPAAIPFGVEGGTTGYTVTVVVKLVDLNTITAWTPAMQLPSPQVIPAGHLSAEATESPSSGAF